MLTYDFIIAKKGDLIQEVSVTGKVKPVESVDLAFEKSGKVNQVLVKVGQKVETGQILIVLESAELLAQLREAEANVKIQLAKLDELKQGTQPEEIQVQETKVAGAKVALEDAKKNLLDKLQDAYTKADDAIRNKVDQFFTNPLTHTPQLALITIDYQLKTDIEGRRSVLEPVLKTWQVSLANLTLNSDFTLYLEVANKNLEQIKSFLNKVALAVNNPNNLVSGLGESIPASWKSDISTARSNINTAISNFTAAEEKLKKAGSDHAIAEQELTLKKAGTIKEQIVTQEAQLEKSKANSQYYQTQLVKTILRSPFDGIVVTQNAKVGEIVSANSNIVSIISEAEFEIEANVPEADIAKIKVDNIARLTLDAYGQDIIFQARIIKIDPAETIIEGVTTYKITLQFGTENERIRSSMTANIDILTNMRKGVIAIPQRAIITKDKEKIVRVIRDNRIEEIKVETGLIGKNGMVEIIQGLSEGNQIITFIEE
ncbi:efflux RND transporter periplasmic adaptor subunit [Patescibacteria group bacterium]|nr:efflux RND transporter periplasmic adaptor subunit [Patescibacteria group bacterium]